MSTLLGVIVCIVVDGTIGYVGYRLLISLFFNDGS